MKNIFGDGDAFFSLFEAFNNIEKGVNQFKGNLGELSLNSYIKNLSIPGYHKCVSNILVPYGNEKTQIDTVFISKKAIICIEFKNLGGWIFGSENQKQWTQSFSKSEKYYFYNPVLQNKGHCKALANVLRTGPENIVPLIVFGERCELKKINCPNTKVISLHQLANYLVLYEREHEDRFTDKNVDAVHALLEMYKPTQKQMEEHIARVKKYSEGTECPKCGCSLKLNKVIKENRKRTYYFGCTNPICAFRRDALYAEVIKYGDDEDRAWAYSQIV